MAFGERVGRYEDILLIMGQVPAWNWCLDIWRQTSSFVLKSGIIVHREIIDSVDRKSVV